MFIEIINFRKTSFFVRYYTISQEKPYARAEQDKINAKKMVKIVKKRYMVFLLDKTAKAFTLSGLQ